MAYVVKAREPTVLQGQSHYRLAGIDLMVGFKVDTAHIVPGEIDLDRFNDALAKTLSVFPVHAGRVERPRDPSDPWKVRLSNNGVPVTIIDNDSSTEVPRNAIIQNPWVLTKGVNFAKYLEYDSDEPLLRVTIIRFSLTGSTSIGLSGSHIIGDGFVMLQFARLLSQNYQGLGPLDEPPNYSFERILPGSVDVDKFGTIPTPDMDITYSLRDIAPHLLPDRVRPQRVDIRLTSAQLKQLHASVQTELSKAEPYVILSRQDTLAALLVYCMSHAEPDCAPIQYVSNIFMSRGIPPRPRNTIGNGLIWAMTDPAENFASETVASIASRIRKALQRARDPEYAAAYDAVHEERMPALANSEQAQDFLQRPGYMIVNSTWKFAWHSAHFGFPGKVRFFHTLLDGLRFVKIFQPNPTRLPDGTWIERPGDMEITFYIVHEARQRFEDLFIQELRRWRVEGEVEFVN